MVDGSIAALAITALSAAIVFETVLDAAQGEPLAVATALAYPLTDLVLLGVAVGALASTGWRLDRTWVLLAVGIISFWLADSLYLVRTALGTYSAPAWFDVGWCARPAADRPRRVAAGGRAPAEHRRTGCASSPCRSASARSGSGLLVYGCLTDMNPLAVGLPRALARGGHGAADADLPRERGDAARPRATRR